MKNEKVILRLSELSYEGAVELGKSVVLCMTANANFPTPSPALSAVATAAQDLENANVAAMNGAVDKIALQAQKSAALNNLLLRLANYVESTANAIAAAGGDARAVIASAGMEYKAERTVHHAPPAAPQHVKASHTDSEGEIRVVWSGVKEALVYVVEITTDPSIVGSGNVANVTNGSPVWRQEKILSQISYILTGLESGVKYGVRLWCVGSYGESAYSTVVVAKTL